MCVCVCVCVCVYIYIYIYIIFMYLCLLVGLYLHYLYFSLFIFFVFSSGHLLVVKIHSSKDSLLQPQHLLHVAKFTAETCCSKLDNM
jgi:hypothetical protein